MTYDYICTHCGHSWEAEQRISEPALKECPSCKHESAKRQVSGGAGFILKGGGWYSDLYSSAKPAEKPTESSDSNKSETKPASGDAAKSSTSSKDAKSSTGSGDGGGSSKAAKTEAA